MLLLFTPGCSQVNQLNERLIVNGIGVDIEDGAYVVTMHVFDAQRASAVSYTHLTLPTIA